LSIVRKKELAEWGFFYFVKGVLESGVKDAAKLRVIKKEWSKIDKMKEVKSRK